MPIANEIATPDPSAPIPTATASEEAEIQALLRSEGIIKDEPAADEAEPEAPADADFDDPEEAAAAAALAAEAGDRTEETSTPAAVVKPVDDEPAISRGLASLAQRETRLVQREQRAAQAERKAQEIMAQADARARMSIEDPVGYYKSLGIDKPADIAATLYYSEMGDKAPAEFRERRELLSMRQKIQQMESRERANQEAQQRATIEQNSIAYLRSTVQNVPDSLPHLKAEALADPDGVARAMYQRIVTLASQGTVGPGQSDEEISALVAQELNEGLKRNIERTRKIHMKEVSAASIVPATKKAPPVAGEKPKAIPKNLAKAQAITHPRVKPATREEELQDVIAKLKSGAV